MQEKDGSWTLHGEKHVGISALACTAFLAAGHLPGDGAAGYVPRRGLDWLLSPAATQWRVRLRAGHGDVPPRHHDPAVDQAVGMAERPPRRRCDPGWRRPSRSSCGPRGGPRPSRRRLALPRGQPGRGPERHRLAGAGAARPETLGCDVPAEAMKQALAYLERCRDPASGGYCYTAGYAPSPACTGTALLALELAGKDFHRSRRSAAGRLVPAQAAAVAGGRALLLRHLLRRAGDVPARRQLLERLPPRPAQALLRGQNRNGSWIGPDHYGPVYATSMAVLALTVEYRLLPIYQREEEAVRVSGSPAGER